MKVLLVCAAGASTSILMKKLEKYAAEKNIELSIAAHSAADYEHYVKDYDVILVGPQVGYQRDNIAETTGKPVDVMAPLDYALGNAENIFKQVDKLYSEIQ